VPHFQLVTVDGDVLGARELGRLDRLPGRVVSSWSRSGQEPGHAPTLPSYI
jgi:hypothetical protein